MHKILQVQTFLLHEEVYLFCRKPEYKAKAVREGEGYLMKLSLQEQKHAKASLNFASVQLQLAKNSNIKQNTTYNLGGVLLYIAIFLAKYKVKIEQALHRNTNPLCLHFEVLQDKLQT